MKWSALLDPGSEEGSRRAASYLRALWRMGYVDLVACEGGSPELVLTARGETLIRFITTDWDDRGVCEVCGDAADPYHRGRVEEALATLERSYGAEISITLCCTRCLTLPEHLLRRVESMLRSWRSGGRPRMVQTETWVIDTMEITGFLDARYRPAQYYLDVRPRAARPRGASVTTRGSTAGTADRAPGEGRRAALTRSSASRRG